ncbi:metal-sensitive transcriptional regulator [Anaerolineales bacterium HSG6]|nr:metal-sensitive transcriptional regulator [Anaerolineales bacterium HSG6]MDM8530861.1 metal-sensitive transcriptional regulator [Anaerolineales bacterium HSG25]
MKEKLSTDQYQKIDKRLQRLEGQVRGVRRMINEGRNCQDILIQLSAVKGASHKIALQLMESYALECVNNPDNNQENAQAISNMVNMLGRIS